MSNRAEMTLQALRFADCVVLAPAGRVDHQNADALRAALAPHLADCATGRDRLVLDCARLEYISSAGLRVLMLAARQVKAQGGSMVVAAMQPVVREVFEISRFNLVFETFGTMREALGRLSPAALAMYGN
jgi:anti-anti-sigma factor